MDVVFVVDGSWSHVEWILGSRCAGSHTKGNHSTRRKKTWLVVVTIKLCYTVGKAGDLYESERPTH